MIMNRFCPLDTAIDLLSAAFVLPRDFSCDTVQVPFARPCTAARTVSTASAMVPVPPRGACAPRLNSAAGSSGGALCLPAGAATWPGACALCLPACFLASCPPWPEWPHFRALSFLRSPTPTPTLVLLPLLLFCSGRGCAAAMLFRRPCCAARCRMLWPGLVPIFLAAGPCCMTRAVARSADASCTHTHDARSWRCRAECTRPWCTSLEPLSRRSARM